MRHGTVGFPRFPAHSRWRTPHILFPWPTLHSAAAARPPRRTAGMPQRQKSLRGSLPGIVPSPRRIPTAGHRRRTPRARRPRRRGKRRHLRGYKSPGQRSRARSVTVSVSRGVACRRVISFFIMDCRSILSFASKKAGSPFLEEPRPLGSVDVTAPAGACGFCVP